MKGKEKRLVGTEEDEIKADDRKEDKKKDKVMIERWDNNTQKK